MLHHVEGVVGEVNLLDAVDDLLLRLGVDGLLPQLPQLLLTETRRQRQETERALKHVLEVSTLESSRHAGTQTEKVQNTELHHFRMKTTNEMCSINVEEGTIKLRKIEKRLIQGKKRGKTPGTEQ